MPHLACCVLAFSLACGASAAAASLTDWQDGAQAGVFLMRPAADAPLTPATLLRTDVDVRVSGPVAHVTVRQSFFNQGGDFAEAWYVFPLPETSAVHAMELVVGQRRIVGRIREKAHAQRAYEAARTEGRRASLVEQTRPNVFTAAVANIASGEEVEVVIEYTQTLVMDDNRFSLRVPMTLTPRYQPPRGPRRHPALDLPDDVAGPVAAPGAPADHVNPARLRVHVDAGGPLAALTSPSHDIHSRRDGAGYRVTLAAGSAPMDRDFLLTWQPDAGSETRAALFSEVVDGVPYGLLVLHPPHSRERSLLARELVFVIDTSGSMGGASIEQARAALIAALNRLGRDDRFNVIAFDSGFTVLFPGTVPADPQNLARAAGFVAGLEAGGGTEMLPALTAALTMPGSPEHLRQIVFITDGAVGNETAILGLLHQRLGDARLFTVGIGSAPNSYFMRKAAQFGRGTFTYVSNPARVQESVSRLFTRLESPVLRDVEVTLPAHVQAELWPRRMPDLYDGEPLLVAMKLSELPDHLAVSGNGSGYWETIVPVPGAGGHPGIAKLWARQKIEALTDRMIRGAPEAEVRPAIQQVALTHGLVSRYTSFVAVDETPVREPADPLVSGNVANLAPHGFAFPQTALGLSRLRLYGTLCLLGALLAWVMAGRGREVDHG